MLNKHWNGILSKFSLAKKGEHVCIVLSIKHTNEGDVQNFIDSFEKELGTDNYTQLFKYPVRWKKLVIDTSDYEKNTFDVEFDEVDFKAKLVEINVSAKRKNGIDVFEYVLNFVKDVETEDTTSAYTYLNNKEENEDGKKVLVEYDVKLSLSDEQSTDRGPEFDAF